MSSFEELEKSEKRGTSDGTDALEVSYAVLSSSTDNPIDLLGGRMVQDNCCCLYNYISS